MNSTHVVATGAGGLVGILAASLMGKIGIPLTDPEAAIVGVSLTGAGLAIGHKIDKAWEGPGIIPAIRRGLCRGIFGSSRRP